MEVLTNLSNISCCLEASEDVSETAVELVICDLPFSNTCCLKWETLTYAAAVVFSIIDLIVDAISYATFADKDDENTKYYLYVWLIFMVFSGFLMITEIHSIVHIRREKTEEEGESFRAVTNTSVIIAEDRIVAIARILMAFDGSAAAIADLQSTLGKISA